jgi:dATP pyrophosphohydrolase
VLVIPFRRDASGVEYAVLRRDDLGSWQAVAGGGEDAETPAQAAQRETMEELSLEHPVPIYPLQSLGSVPAHYFADREHWPAGTYVIPEHSFAADLTGVRIALSAEHTAVQWLGYQAAKDVLTWDSNRTALGELHERLGRDDLPGPGE